MTGGSSDKTNPPDAAIVYKGPVALPKQKQAATTMSAQMYLTHIVTTNVSGIVNDVVGNNPAGFAEFSNFQALWSEYRVLAVEYTYVPSYKNVQGTIAFGPCVFTWDRYNNTALASIAGAYEQDSAIPMTLGNKCHRILKMHDTLDAEFRSTNPGTTDTWWFKVYGSGYSNSTTYGILYMKALVQFRGRL